MMENIAVADSSVEEGDAKKAAKAAVALKQLGDFRIIREIGHGGMGVVYEAEQVSLGRHVALKVLPSQALADAKQKRRFEREAKAAAKLHHTNIVPVFGVGEHDGLPYYVMQFIQGLGLDVVLDELNHMQPAVAHTPTGLPTAGEIRVSRRSVAPADVARSLLTGAFEKGTESDEDAEAAKPPVSPATLDQAHLSSDKARPSPLAPDLSASGLSESFTVTSSSIVLPGSSTSAGQKSGGNQGSYWQSVAHIGRQVADALDYAHKQGILHRDVKPSNLLLDLRGTVWVTDFGLAKVAGPGVDNLTHTGDIMGTLRYMPPEAFEGKSDARSDVYSLGLTLYELLAMRPAFDEKDRNKLIKQMTTGEPAPLHKIKREAPRDLVTIVHKAIDRDPARRYATAEHMASDLQRFLDDEPILARRQTLVERYWRWARRNPGIALLGGVLTAVLVIVTVASLIIAKQMATLADNARHNEEKARQASTEAEEARKIEEQAKEDARQKLVRMHLTTANLYADRNDHAAALHWVAKAWQDDRSQHAVRPQLSPAEITENHRVRVGAALENLPPLVGACFHDRPVLDADFDPIGRLAATHVGDQRAFVWNWAKGELACPPLEHQGVVAAVAFSPDGKRLATAAADGAARIWDTESGRLLHRIPHNEPVTWVAFSPDGTILATASGDRAHRWDTVTGLRHGQALQAGAGVDYVRFSPDGNKFVTATPQQLIIWDAVKEKRLAEPLPQRRIAVAQIADMRIDPDCIQLERRRHRPVFRADSQALVTSYRNQLLLWTIGGIRKYTIPIAADSTEQVDAAFTPDGQSIIYVWRRNSFTHTIHIPSGRQEDSRNRLSRQLGGIRISPSGRLTAIPITSGDIYLSPAGGLLRTANPLRNSQTVSQFNFDASGRLLWAASLDGVFRVWEVVPRQQPYAFDCGQAHHLVVYGWAYSSDGLKLAEITANGIRLGSRVPDVLPAREFPLQGARLVSFGPKGNVLLAASNTRTRVWQVSSGDDVTPKDLRTRGTRAWYFDERETRLATLAPDGRLAVWDLAKGSCLFSPQHPIPLGANVLLDRSGEEVLVSESEDVIRGWEVSTGKPRPIINLHKSAYITSMAFGGPDGRFVTTSTDLTVRQWDKQTHEPAGPTFRANKSMPAAGAAFSPDGRWIAYTDENVQLSLADARTGEPLAAHSLRIAGFYQNLHFSADGRRIVMQAVGNKHIDQWMIPRYEISPDHLPALVRFLTGFSLDETEGLTPIDPNEWLRNPEPYRAAWRAWRADFSRLVVRTDEDSAWTADLYTIAKDWERAIAEYRTLVTRHPTDGVLLTKLARAYQGAGRTRESVAYLAKASTVDPNHTELALQVAALQAWFGQDKELATTLERIRTFAKDARAATTCDRAVKACSVMPSASQAQVDAALALARKGVQLDKDGMYRNYMLLALGMAEYRSGHYAAADEALVAAAKADPNNRQVTGIAGFYRAMSLFRQGNDEARQLALAAVARMKALPKDEENPLANNANHDDLILWLAYKEAKAMIRFDDALPAKGKNDKK
jgi:eukaryotic-like serine/threonine-protein kinase